MRACTGRLVGLERNTTAPYDFPATDHPSSRHDFASRQSVMVWSFGPDGAIDFNLPNLVEGKADAGKNQDKVLSW